MSTISAVSESFSFVPRLVVHKAEVQKIFHPNDRFRSNNDNPADEESLVLESRVLQDADLNVSNGSIFLRGVVPDVTAIRNRVRQLALELPEHMRTAPVILARIATEIPMSIANRAVELPSNLLTVATDIPTTIISLAEGVEGTMEAIVQISSDVAREVVELPHRASFEWKQLFWVLFLLVLAPMVIFGVVFFIPMNSVNDGIQNNRSFVYGIMTFYQLLTIAPWIETCNFAMPKAKIPLRARILTLLWTLIATKCFDAIIVEGVLGKKIFPIPFSILVSGLLGFIGVVPSLYMMTPSREKRGFGKMQRVLCAYWVSLILVIFWAVGVHRLRGRPLWQSGVITLYGPLRFVCKILIAAPITTDHNPHRWIQLNLVVDIIFTRVQVSTFPFIDSYVTLLMLFSTEVLTLAWRYYSGVDRLALWWNAIWMTPTEKATPTSSKVYTEFFRRASNITKGCLRAPIPLVSELNMNLRDKECQPERIMRTLTGDTCETIDEGNSEGSDYVTDEVANLEKKPGQSNLETHTLDIDKACDIADERASHEHQNNGLVCECNLETVELQDGVVNGIISMDTTRNDVSQRGREPAYDALSRAPSTVSFQTNQDSLPDLELIRPFTSFCSRTVLLEEDWEQRPLYHVVDATGANVISIIVRVNQQLSIAMVRGLPSSNHLNDSFEISDQHWMKAQIYGWTFIALMLLLLALVGCAFFRRLHQSEENKLSLSRVMSYLFKDHFWFFFLWLVSTGAFVCASMVNHFGADFSMRFDWVSCSEEIAWPGCPP